MILFVLGIAAGGWLAYRGMQARSVLTTALPQVQQLQDQMLAGDQTGARATLGDLRDKTDRARGLTSDPVWTMAGWMPWIGANFSAAADVAAGVDDLADDVLLPVIDSSETLDVAALGPTGGHMDLAPLAGVAPEIGRAAAVMGEIESKIVSIDPDDLMEPVAAPVRTVQKRIEILSRTLRTGDRAAQLLPPMLGADGPRRYVLLLQTNAELRATGGLAGVLLLATAQDGTIELTEQLPATSMTKYDTPVLPLEPEDEALYTDRLGRFVSGTNLTPDFTTTAPLIRELWRLRTGEEVDGVIAADPVALSYLLRATGPIDDGTGQRLTANNAVDVLLSEAYERYPDTTEQDAFFAGVASNVFNALIAGQGNPAATMPALGKAAGEHRILVWSAHPEEQALLEGTVLAGHLPASDEEAEVADSTVGVYFNDSTGSKMDYYLDTEISVAGSTCTGDEGVHTLRVELASNAPLDAATSLPESVTGPGVYGVPKGLIGTHVVLIGPHGGQIAGVRLDGNLVAVEDHTQDGRPATGVSVELAPGEVSVLEVDLVDPSPGDELNVWSTPTKDQPGAMTVPRAGISACIKE